MFTLYHFTDPDVRPAGYTWFAVLFLTSLQRKTSFPWASVGGLTEGSSASIVGAQGLITSCRCYSIVVVGAILCFESRAVQQSRWFAMMVSYMPIYTYIHIYILVCSSASQQSNFHMDRISISISFLISLDNHMAVHSGIVIPLYRVEIVFFF